MKVPWTAGNYISDCLQKDWLKLDYVIDANGIRQLIIKAGSKWYYPDGLDSNNNPKYSIFTAPIDYKSTYAATNTTKAYFMLDTRGNGNVNRPNGWGVCLGSTYENSIGYSDFQWWDTTNNKIKHTTDSGSTWTDVPCTLPIGMAQYVKNVGVTEFVPFTFCGCMGNGVFSLPFEADIASGFDSYGNAILSHQSYTAIQNAQLTWNGTYTNKIFLRKSQASMQFINNNQMNISGNRNLYIQSATPTTTISADWYNPENNIVQYYSASDGTWTQTYNWFIAECGWNGTYKRFTMFKPFTNIDGLTDLPSLAKYYL